MLLAEIFTYVRPEPASVISVNLWQILIALCNLVILFLLLKKFLFKPVKKTLEERQKAIDDQFAAAEEAQKTADDNKEQWEKQLATASDEAKDILKNAEETAAHRGDRIVADARDKADAILRQAESEADLERRKAQAEIKDNIIDISAELAGKMLEREINPDDHRRMIDAFIEEMGDAE